MKMRGLRKRQNLSVARTSTPNPLAELYRCRHIPIGWEGDISPHFIPNRCLQCLETRLLGSPTFRQCRRAILHETGCFRLF